VGPVADAWSTGMALLLSFGRLGCVTSGCCYGKLSCLGPKYPWSPAVDRARFDPDDRFFPVQILELLCLLALCLVGLAILRIPHEPGDATVLFLSGYAVARFGLEMLRGDSRRYFRGFSEAQWCSLMLAGGALGAAWAAQPEHAGRWAGAAASVALAFAAEMGIGIIAGTPGRPVSRSRASLPDRR
jgi:prolipoprotein diacylglyceryltransferase